MRFSSPEFHHLTAGWQRMPRKPQRRCRFAVACLTLAALILAAACSRLPAPITSTPTALPTYAPTSLPAAHSDAPRTAAIALIQAERESAIAGDLATLHALWTDDARIVDGRGTESEADDYVWQGRDAIMDRYELAVLPAPPPPFDPDSLSDLSVERLTADIATAEIGVDRWTLTRVDGRWQLSELRYN